MCFWRTRNGDVFFANGIDRPRKWDTVTASAELAGITAPTSAPTASAASGGAATAGVYVVAVQYIDDTLPDPVQSDISALATITLTANQKVSLSSIPVSPEARVTQKRIWLSTSGETETLYLAATIANATTTYSGYTSNDATLAAQTYLPILQPNGDLNARRFTPPPNDKPYAVVYQDRVFMAGRVAYNVGTVAVNGTTTVTGTGTAWTTQMAGRYIYVSGEPAPLVISSVASATSLTLTTAATTTASGKSYTIIPSPKLRNTIFFCCDDATEILTKRGWLRHTELTTDDEALTLEAFDNKIEWQKVKKVNRFPFSGFLNHWNAKQFDAMTTDDHRWIAKGCGVVGGYHRYRPKGGFHMTTTTDCNRMSSKRLIVSGGTMAEREAVYDDEFVELVGWYVTEGSIQERLRKRTGTIYRQVRIAQCEAHNPGYVKRIRRLSEHYKFRGVGVAEYTGRPFARLFAFRGGLADRLAEVCPGKMFTMGFLLELTPSQLVLLRDTMLCADGHHHKGDTWLFSQNNLNATELFQTLCAMTGRRTKYRVEKPITRDGKTFAPGHVTTVYHDFYLASVKLPKQKVYYNGIVWCPTTANGTWMARRNGYTYWTGNSEDDEPESFGGTVTTLGVSEITNEVTIQDNTGDEDEITGLMPYGSYLYILKERHIYSLSFIRQPKIDVGIHCIAWRGCLNHRCWDILDGVGYLMDQSGIYRFTGGDPEPIDAAIQNQFWDGTIDFSVAKWFWVKADTARKLVYFAVSYTADSSTRPKRALVFDAVKQTWLPEQWIWEVGGAAVIPISGKAQLLVGAEHDLVLATGQGTSDMVTAVRGTATSAASTTLTDSGAAFTSSMVDAPLGIISGTGAGQFRRISAQTSTQLTVSSAWTTTPDSTSVYLVGAIQWNHKTGQLEFPASEKTYTRELLLEVAPTTHTNLVNVRQFKNKSSTASNQQVSEDRGTGVTAVASTAPFSFDVTSGRVPQDNFSGVQKVAIPGTVDDRSNAQRWVAFELYGFAGQDQITIDGYEIRGVK